MPPRRSSPEHQEAVSRRLALLSAELGRADPTVPSVPSVSVPGRHAAGRVTLGTAQLAVVAVLVAVGLAVTCWFVVRGDADRVEAPALSPVTAAAPDEPLTEVSPVGAGPAAASGVTVDVAGKVRRPGIVVLDAGSRVVDAIEAAGGARPGVDLSSLNLARLLVDGEQVLVGVAVPTGVTAAAAAAGEPAGALVNLNTAGQTELEALPEVGPVTALAILSWRDEHGGFTAVDELLEVDGIGDATLEQLAPHVTV
ncbi:helix-hairpin-helix domain-containing protein [Nocardioides sp. SR21]|uniref:helix-hairpin-helix domain-containing protein n=1 Tax=Nocardioides sp. SR21 TaxID=2919501 RepID=UPI001FA99F02|nr:helix-hairpin-helix domain-containing protein [Nocardioides sp. SR21]